MVTLAGLLFVVAVVVGLLASGRSVSRLSKVLLLVVPVFAAALAMRTSPWVVVPVAASIVLLLALGTSFANASSLRATFPDLAVRLGLVLDHVVLAPGMCKPDEAADSSVARRRLNALGRGAVLALPILCIVGGLLGMADPVFRSWFDPPRMLHNALLIAVGGWILLGFVRAASAKAPTFELRPAPRLGTVEVVAVLGSLSALYATFVAAQIVAAVGGSDHVEATRGLTYASYAREGFFQLLAAAAVTLLVILGVRACADRARLSVLAVSQVTITLTLAVVGVAIYRLELYRDAYGLTPLRLASSVTAVWIGVVFVLLAVAVGRRGGSSDWFAPAVVVSGLAFVAVWTWVNPVAVVAAANMDRAKAGATFDPVLIAELGADAVPTVAANLDDLDPAQRTALTELLCADRPDPGDGVASNVSTTRADDALEPLCRGGTDA